MQDLSKTPRPARRVTPNASTGSDTAAPSRLQLFHSVPTFMEALEKANLDPIREQLGAPSGTGRPPLDRDPMMKLYLISRCRRTEVPREMTPLLEWPDTDRHSLTTLCGFDQVPSRSTLRTVFLELDGLKNEVRIAQAQVIRLLKEKDGDGLSYQAARRWVMGCCFCNP